MREWNEFDRELVDAVTELPPSPDTVRAVTPWRNAMDRDPLLWAAVWYAVLITLALFWPKPGWVTFFLMAFAFYRIVKSLYAITAELEDWGCSVRAAPVRLSGGQLQLAYYTSLLALVLLCGLFPTMFG